MSRAFPAAALPAALLVLALATPALASQAILPGYWESTNAVTFPLPDKKTERKCISAAQIEDYLSGPSNNHYTCHYDSRRVEDGQLAMQGHCVDNNGLTSKIKVEGAYTPTSFNLKGHLQMIIGGLTVPVEASTDAHRISAACPADASR
jgi:hypothetical protein